MANSRSPLTQLEPARDFHIGIILVGSSLLFVDQNTPRGQGGNTYITELSSNGPYQFFGALRNNELDYQQFFANLPAEQAGQQIRTELAESNAVFTGAAPK
ncbi:hypothetical protein K5D56_11845 [Pseudomonas cichorii]|nr:hypothetical protein [Pseudomonas cichorii]